MHAYNFSILTSNRSPKGLNNETMCTLEFQLYIKQIYQFRFVWSFKFDGTFHPHIKSFRSLYFIKSLFCTQQNPTRNTHSHRVNVIYSGNLLCLCSCEHSITMVVLLCMCCLLYAKEQQTIIIYFT